MASQLELYIGNQAEIVKECDGKIVAVKDGKALGDHPTYLDAWDAMKAPGFQELTSKTIRCTPGKEQYTAKFRHRIGFKHVAANM
jgi:hypothetical protein